jgi:phenylalanyl-tRNA synthetase beta chain
MPVIGIPVDMLNERIETTLQPDDMVSKLQQLGCDVEGYATLRRFCCGTCGFLMEITETENPPVTCSACGEDFKVNPSHITERGTSEVIRMELLAVRPDMFDPAGLARTLRGYLGEFVGPVTYDLAEPTVTVHAEAGLTDKDSPNYRPIRCAVVRNVRLDDDRIKVLMKLQENLHWAMGRDRKRASIGVYDMATFQASQGLTYRLVAPDGLTFVPLGKKSLATPKQVLEEHPKGVAYAHLLADKASYPLLAGSRSDGSDVVLAMIPIINSEDTKVTQRSKDLLIDVTGLDDRLIEKILNTILTSILELCPESKGEKVVIAPANSEPFHSPDLTPQRVVFDTDLPAKRVGIPVDSEQVKHLLKKMGHGLSDDGNGRVVVEVPAYRNDILHPVDLVEDCAIAYGYHNIVPSLVPSFTVGEETPRSAVMNRVRQAFTGHGFMEVLTLILSNEADQFEKLGRKDSKRHVELAHPISQDQTLIRTSIIPGLLDTLSVNTDQPLPQKIFEVGRISLLDETEEVGAREHLRVAAAIIGSRVDFADIKSIAESLLAELCFGDGAQCQVVDEHHGSFGTYIPGRGATIGTPQTEWVQFGELHPQVLENFGLGYPVTILECSLEVLIS